MAGRIDDEPNPRWDEWINKPLSDAEKERILKAVHGHGGGGGSSSSSGCLMTLLMWLGMAVMVASSSLLLGGWAS
jgi:hypothetical protein